MKKLLPLLLCILLLSGCAERYDGPTRSVSVLSETVTEHYYALGGKLAYIEREVNSYDVYGNLAQTVEYLSDEPQSKTVYTYDDRGSKLTETHYDLTGWFPKRTHRAEYAYDEQNRMISYQTEDTAYVFDYDDETNTCTTTLNGELYEVTVRNASGDILTSRYLRDDWWRLSEFTYDTEGRTLTRQDTDSDGYEYWCRYEYDSQGNTVYMEEIENGSRTETRYSNEYDEQGRRVRRSTLYAVPVEERRWEYLDEDGSVTCWQKGHLDYTILRDELGRTTEETHYYENPNEIASRVTYIFRDIQVPVKEGST